MKKVNSTKYLMMAMTAAVCMTLTACGGDDKEDDIPGDGAATGIGVHRIDVQYSDNAAGCRVMNIFYGVRKDGSMADLYENGVKLERDAMSGTWYTEELRDLSVQTEDGCGGMVARISGTSSWMIWQSLKRSYATTQLWLTHRSASRMPMFRPQLPS